MSAPTNTYTSYDVTGLKEDLSDMVSNITPVDEFFYKEIGSRKSTQKKHEHMTDSLSSVDTSNAQIEGDSKSAEAITAATKIYNMHQIMDKTFAVSDSNKEMVAAGDVNSEEYQTFKFSQELAQDREYMFLRQTRNDGSTSTARKMRGALNWVTTNLNKAGDATLNSDGTVTGGTPRDLTRTLLKETMQDIWDAGGKPKEIICGAYQHQRITDLAGVGAYRWMVEKAKMDDVIDVYVNEFGTYKIRKHRQMPTDVLFICDKDKWEKASLRKIQKRQLAKSSDSTTWNLICEETVISVNEAASGRITDLSTS